MSKNEANSNCSTVMVKPLTFLVLQPPLIPLTVDPALITEDARRRFGIIEELPLDPGMALSALSNDNLFCKKLGNSLVSTFVSLMGEYNKILDNIGPIGSNSREKWLTARL